MVLTRICEPLNAYRVFLLIVMFVAMALVMMFVGEPLGIVKLEISDNPINLACMLFIVASVLFAYFIISMVMKVLVALRIMTE